MEQTINRVLNLYQDACRQYYNIKGLIYSLIIPLLIIPLIAKLIMGLDVLKNSCLSFMLTTIFYIFLYFVTSLFIVIIWFIKRSVPKITKDKIGILFGPAYNEEAKKEFDDISTKLRKEIEVKDILKIISIKTLPPNIEVGQHSKNLEVLGKANAAVLICGNFESFTADGRHITGFSSFTISARTLPVSPQDTPIILNDAIVGRQLGWTEENTIHKNVVINNLSEIARYIVGLSLIADGKFEKAILRPLLLEINHKYAHKRLPIEIQRFKKTIQTAVVVSLVDIILKEYNKALFDERLFSLGQHTLQKWSGALNEGLRIDNQSFGALLLLAIVQFLSSDVNGAKDSIRKARQFMPLQGHNLCDLSEAFLLCFEGNLREARKIYKKLTKNPPTYQTMSNIFSFIAQAIEAFKDKPQIRFVYALLNDEYGDKSIALEEFNKFILETESNELYKQWNREACIRIKRIEQSEGTALGEE